MLPQVFRQLWESNGGVLPYLDGAGYRQVCRVSCAFEAEGNPIEFWGLICDSVRYRGHPVFRCYNFGNLCVSYPWNAKLANFGIAVDVTITMAGTLRPAAGRGALLDSLAEPYLVLGYEAASHVTEFVQPGMLIGSERGRMGQRREFDVVIPDGSAVPEGGVLYYCLMKKLRFQMSAIEPWVTGGQAFGLPRGRITVSQPICVAAGWPLLMLARGRWVWGVVAS